MFFQVYCFKNVGVAGYVEAFEMVQLEKQASYMGYLFRNRCTSEVDGVSGATFSSKTIKAAVRNALSKGKAN